jgi:ferredoxin/flavodoxin---NADP+ reductase
MGQHKLLNIRFLSASAYILRFERNSFNFLPGQHIYVGLNDEDNRPYSVYSGINDDFIEILVREVMNGRLSKQLKLLHTGDYVSINQPQGTFIIESEERMFKTWLICTGTGISPFHSFVRSYPDLDYRIIHGVRFADEAFEREVYGDEYVCCTSRESKGDFNGRVTTYLENEILSRQSYYFLCGNYNMIDEVFELLVDRGIDKMNIKAEGYF